MQSDTYKGYAVWGHAIQEQRDVLEREKFAASGTVTRGGKFVEASGVLGAFESEVEAQKYGLNWARAWIDSHD